MPIATHRVLPPPMKRLSEFARRVGDAALQLTLPLFDVGPIQPPRPRPPVRPGRTALGGEAQRTTLLSGQAVRYVLQRSTRRTIGFRIDGAGLRVTAPRWVSQRDIEQALTEKSAWILRKLVEWQDHAEQREARTIRWEDGAVLSVLGQTLRISVSIAARPGVRLQGTTLQVEVRPESAQEDVREQVQGWLKQYARLRFGERIPVLAARLGRAPRRWTLSSARTRWGSCSPDGSIRLNWRLIHFPLEVIDYVIAHELAHLVHMNHSPAFWATVASLYPDYEAARAVLKDYPDDLVLS